MPILVPQNVQQEDKYKLVYVAILQNCFMKEHKVFIVKQ